MNTATSDAILPDVQYAAMTRVQRLAAFLIMLGHDTAGLILQRLEKKELETVSLEMAKMPFITQSVQNELLREFTQIALQASTGVCGGPGFVQNALEKSLGVMRANDIIRKVRPGAKPTVPDLQSVLDMEAKPLANILKHEQPQAVAMIVSYLPPDKASNVLNALPEENREDVIERLANMAPTPVETVERLASVLKSKIGPERPTRPPSQTGGVDSAAQLLNSMDRDASQNILSALEGRNPELTQEIRNKMFTFEDLSLLDSGSLQKILREVDLRDLAVSLKGASDKLKNALLGSISKRAAETVNEEISFMGAVKGKEKEQAQQRIIDAMRKLEAVGEIDLSEALEAAQNA